jgi:hypothetical protein
VLRDIWTQGLDGTAAALFGINTRQSEACLFSSVGEEASTELDGFGGLVVRKLASGSRVRGFKSGRSRCLPPKGKLNNLSHVPTLRHVKEPSNCGKITGCLLNSFDKKFPPSLAEGSRAAWCDGASGDE